MDKFLTRKNLVGAGFALGAVLLSFLLFSTPVLEATLGTDIFTSLERKGYDVLMQVRGARTSSNDVILVRLDEYTLDKLGGWPISHDQYGAVITLLSTYGAKAVALDVVIGQAKNEQDSIHNDLMVQYLANAHNVFNSIAPYIPETSVGKTDVDSAQAAVVGKFGIRAPGKNLFLRIPYFDEIPFPALAQVSTGLGHITVIPEDGVIRSIPLFIEYSGKLYPSLGFALALHALKIGPGQISFSPNDLGVMVKAGSLEFQAGHLGEVRINYVGKDSMIPSVSFFDILNAASNKDERFFAQFKNKVCIIGPTTRSIGDFYATPVSASSPGYVTHANFYDTVMTGNFIDRADAILQFVILLILTLAIGIVAQLNQTRIGVGVSLGILTLYLLFAYFSFASANTWYDIVSPMFATFICFGSTVAYRAATEGKQKKVITNMFERYVDKTVVQNLINNPAMLKLGGEKREITLLFSDIKGFTTISEKIPPEVLVKLLNQYLTEMTNIIMRNKGTVDKFIGDAIMAFWGAPLEDENAAFHGCLSALEMQERLDKLQTKIRNYGDIEIRQRVGVNTGVCIVGNMGSESKFNYTAMGDPVNLASRLEGTNKQYGTAILISEFTYKLVSKKVLAREVDRVQVVGKTEPVRIYELMQLADKPVSTYLKQFLEAFQEGVKCYQERKWEEGIAYMEHAKGFIPDDPVCNIYIERIKLFQIHPPEKNWNGVFVLSAK